MCDELDKVALLLILYVFCLRSRRVWEEAISLESCVGTCGKALLATLNRSVISRF